MATTRCSDGSEYQTSVFGGKVITTQPSRPTEPQPQELPRAPIAQYLPGGYPDCSVAVSTPCRLKLVPR
jgi:hypothetical protein